MQDYDINEGIGTDQTDICTIMYHVLQPKLPNINYAYWKLVDNLFTIEPNQDKIYFFIRSFKVDFFFLLLLGLGQRPEWRNYSGSNEGNIQNLQGNHRSCPDHHKSDQAQAG